MTRDRKKLLMRIYPQDIEYIEYYLRNEADAGDGYYVIGNPVVIKIKSDEND